MDIAVKPLWLSSGGSSSLIVNLWLCPPMVLRYLGFDSDRNEPKRNVEQGNKNGHKNNRKLKIEQGNLI